MPPELGNTRDGTTLCFNAKPFLTAWWLRLGYHTLTGLFVGFTLIFGFAALRPV